MATQKQVSAQLRKQLVDVARESCLRSALRIPERTRKYSGQARASIRMGVGAPDLTVTYVANYIRNAINGTIGLAGRHFADVSSRIRVGDKVYITSNLEYIRNLEYEFGDLMFTSAAAKWRQDVAASIR